MKRIFTLICTAALISAFTAACSDEGTGHRPGKQDEHVTVRENPDWKVSAFVDGLSADVTVQSISNDYYYVDIIRLNEYKSTFGSDMKSYLLDEATVVKSQAASENKSFREFMSQGNSTVNFSNLTEETWVAVAFGMNSDWTLTGAYAWTTFDVADNLVLTLNPAWKIQYTGRKIDTQDGVSADVDVIKVTSTDSKQYCLDIVTADNLKQWYGGDLKAYIQDEPNYYNGEIYSGNMEILFDRMRSGSWKAVAYGVTSSGKPTGDYAMLDYTIKAETASAEFSRWLGSWLFSGKDKDGKAVSYNIDVESSDPNYIFTISGWETGSQCTRSMDGYSFETTYDRFRDKMLFNGLYLETYQDSDNNDVDFCFYGNFDFQGEQYALTDALTIAEASISSNGASGTVKGCDFNFNDNGTTYPATFKSMQYMDLPVSSDDLYIYNENVPLFPITMTRSSSQSKVSAASEARKVLKVRPSRYSGANAAATMSKARKNAGMTVKTAAQE